MKEITNFWEVISEFNIEIPIIQRDYAQGRRTFKVDEIRKKIIDDMFDSLKKGKTLEFDFVYGNIDARSNGNYFIPLDGQQRLTTLFLLHWYLSFLSRDFDSLCSLSNFTYETRTSSREFCLSLVENAMNLPQASDRCEISSVIKNEAWFFLSWIKDPTIKAMLQTLDDIHIKFFGSGSLWEKLCDKDCCPIVFRFVKLEDFGLEDDLYIKMNARGKPLTDFENFKAKFEQHLEEYFEDELGYFSHKIDGSWTDLFWSPPENARFDGKYLSFFKNVAINNYALKIDAASIKHQNQITSMFRSIPTILQHIDDAGLRDIKVLNILPEIKAKKIEFVKQKITDLFQDIIQEQPTYSQRLMFYALSRFLTANKLEENSDELSNWLRVIYNLVRNTEYDESVEFSRSIKSIADMVKHSKDILSYISHSQNTISGFNAAQIEEERIKATLMMKSDDWKSIIITAESHGYFDGQLSFILLFSGITSEYQSSKISDWADKDCKYFFNSFLNYYEKACAVFSEEGLMIKSYLWERALLCKGYYWIGKGDKVSLLQNIHRDYSWKRLLRDTDNNNEKRLLVKNVLDEISVSSIIDDLKRIIENNTVADIRSYFIEDPEIIGACNGKFIQKFEDTFLLLKTSITAGYHKELKSYALYLKLIKSHQCKKEDTEYLEQCGINNPKKIIRINGNEIEITYSNEQFIILLEYEKFSFDDEKKVIGFLEQRSILPMIP